VLLLGVGALANGESRQRVGQSGCSDTADDRPLPPPKDLLFRAAMLFVSTPQRRTLDLGSLCGTQRARKCECTCATRRQIRPIKSSTTTTTNTNPNPPLGA